MAQVIPQATPNPQAYKFTIEGHSFSGPLTISGRDGASGTPFEGLFELPGVASIFATANFVTIMKDPAADWGTIVEPAREHLERAF
ncbi:MAG: NifU N-terminal domain-containing protein [Planctomycetota bacterium]|nr:NifU N-terminal domain-containing protein [Planctomycetota bacterium]